MITVWGENERRFVPRKRQIYLMKPPKSRKKQNMKLRRHPFYLVLTAFTVARRSKIARCRRRVESRDLYRLARPRAWWYQLQGFPLVGSDCVCPQCNRSFVFSRGSAMPSAIDLPVHLSRAHKKRQHRQWNSLTNRIQPFYAR